MSCLTDKVVLFYTAQNGYVVRNDGLLNYIRTGFNLTSATYDLDGSATAAQQPRLIGGIAPNSKPAAANLNGESRYFTHPEISFEAGDAWSVTTVINLNENELLSGLWGDSSTHALRLSGGSSNGGYQFRLITAASTNTYFGDSRPLIGKNSCLTLVGNNGLLKVYLNGLLINTVTQTTDLVLNRFLYGRGQASFSNISTYLIQSQALTPTEVADLHTTLRGLYPEIESVDIGTQTWATRNFEAVATPEGNVIANVTENGAVEKLDDTSFNDASKWVMPSPDWSVSGGQAIKIAGSGVQYISQNKTVTSGKWYKIELSISASFSNFVFATGGNTLFSTWSSYAPIGTGTLIFYAKALLSGTNIQLYGLASSTCTLDSFSIEELNWSNATEIYDAVYAATTGTADEKEYAALKEAAMWAYHTDVNNGAIYGKIFNGYAKKLFKSDMLSADFGWHIGTDAEYQLIDDSAYDLMYGGTDYWTTDNGTNTTGFTALGGGYRLADGTFSTIKGDTRFWVSDEDKTVQLTDNSDTVTIAAEDLRIGAYIRLTED